MLNKAMLMGCASGYGELVAQFGVRPAKSSAGEIGYKSSDGETFGSITFSVGEGVIISLYEEPDGESFCCEMTEDGTDFVLLWTNGTPYRVYQFDTSSDTGLGYYVKTGTGQPFNGSANGEHLFKLYRKF